MNSPITTRFGAARPGAMLARISWLSVLAVAAGCAGTSPSDLEIGNLLHRETSAADSPYGPTPADRVDELRGLDERADEMTPAQQQEISAQLAQRLQTETDPILRRQLVRTLSAFATPSAISGLHQAAQDPDPDIRIAACEGWQRIGGEQASRALVTALRSDTNIDVRLAAAKSLGGSRDSVAMTALTDALDDPDPALRRRARLSLASVTGEDSASDVKAWPNFVGHLGPGRHLP